MMDYLSMQRSEDRDSPQNLRNIVKLHVLLHSYSIFESWYMYSTIFHYRNFILCKFFLILCKFSTMRGLHGYQVISNVLHEKRLNTQWWCTSKWCLLWQLITIESTLSRISFSSIKQFFNILSPLWQRFQNAPYKFTKKSEYEWFFTCSLHSII